MGFLSILIIDFLALGAIGMAIGGVVLVIVGIIFRKKYPTMAKVFFVLAALAEIPFIALLIIILYPLV